jgi:single-strand DNA-binding protein
MSVNKVILIGNVGKDPETRYLENGTPVSNFTLATNEIYNRNGEKVTNTEWHNIVVWRTLADVAQKYVKKGSQVFIEGKIRTRSWDDKDGNKRYTTEIVADSMQLLGRKPEDGMGGSSTPAQENKQASSEYDSIAPAQEITDDLPF